MKRYLSFYPFILFAVCLFLNGCGSKFGDKIVACGDNKVLIIDTKKSTTEKIKIDWQWQISDAQGLLPDEYMQRFRSIDECKPVDNNRKLLVTSSSDAVVLLDIKTKKPLFYAYTPMAHSAEMLPDNKIAVALSTHVEGNSIEIFDVNKPNQTLLRDTLYSGHGVVWVKKRSLLYVLGYDVLRAYALKDWNTDAPKLEMRGTWTLPFKSGHDLSFVSDDELLVTGHENICLFDMEQGTFKTFAQLDGYENIKSVNYDATSQQTIYTKAEVNWWTHHIYSQNPNWTLTIDSINLYKVRIMR